VKRLGIGLICSSDNCENYEGHEIGYCHRHRVILKNTTEKDYFAGLCFMGGD
jgi:hypothetical protein